MGHVGLDRLSVALRYPHRGWFGKCTVVSDYSHRDFHHLREMVSCAVCDKKLASKLELLS